MKPTFLFFGLLAITVALAFGQTNAAFVSTVGRVEVQAPGSSEWTAAETGQAIAPGTIVSTGFNASATVSIGASTIDVQQLTRMQIEDIVDQSDSVQTRLNLNVGRVSAQVRSSDGRAQSFEVRSPVSTASVRGTDFNLATYEIDVSEGEVEYALNAIARSFDLQAGQGSAVISLDGALQDPIVRATIESFIASTPLATGADDVLPTGFFGGLAENLPGDATRSAFGTVVVEVN